MLNAAHVTSRSPEVAPANVTEHMRSAVVHVFVSPPASQLTSVSSSVVTATMISSP